jgi:hypothetical protein
LWYHIGQFVDDMCIDERISNATPQFIGALTEMIWTQIGKQLPPRSFFAITSTFPASVPIKPKTWLTDL